MSLSGDVADPRDRVLYSPMPTRPRIEWPGQARVAFWISPNVEHYEYLPPPNNVFNMFSRVPVPDVQQYAYRDYGNRVGFWRLADLLDDLGLRATVSLNLEVLDRYPEIRDAILSRGWAIMSHGLVNTQPVYGYSEELEREFFEHSVEVVRLHTGQQLRGMLGPALSTNLRTPDLMAEYGLTYHTDWPHDDQPVPIRTRVGRLVSVPYQYELNDGVTLPFSIYELAEHCRRQFDRLWQEGAESGRVLCIALHPFLIGQPQALGALRRVLEHIMSHDGVWYTTADEIAAHYLEHCYDDYMESAGEMVNKP
jgi:allantoinase